MVFNSKSFLFSLKQMLITTTERNSSPQAHSHQRNDQCEGMWHVSPTSQLCGNYYSYNDSLLGFSNGRVGFFVFLSNRHGTRNRGFHELRRGQFFIRNVSWLWCPCVEWLSKYFVFFTLCMRIIGVDFYQWGSFDSINLATRRLTVSLTVHWRCAMKQRGELSHQSALQVVNGLSFSWVSALCGLR